MVRTGGGTGGSRSLQLGGSAVSKAADETPRAGDRGRGADARGQRRGRRARRRRLRRRRRARRTAVSWPALAAYAHEHDGGLGVDTDFTQDGATFPFGAHVVDRRGRHRDRQVTPLRHIAVDDCGRIVNPLIVAGQQHGGAHPGHHPGAVGGDDLRRAGHADHLARSPTTPSRRRPTAIMLEASNTETPTPVNPIGAKGIGESATIGSTPAVQNAVVDALRHLGVKHIDLPCTPERVWREIQNPRSDVWREPPAAFDRLGATTASEPDDRRGLSARSYTWGVSAPVSPAAGAAGPAVEIDGLVMRYGDKVAVDGLVADRRARHHHRRARPQRRRQDDHARDLRGLPRAAAGHGAGARPRPASASAASCSPGSA